MPFSVRTVLVPLLALLGAVAASAPAPAPARGPEQPYSVAMHMHGSFSEGMGSMEWHTQDAAALGLDVLWWTDHDWRVEHWQHTKRFDFEADVWGPVDKIIEELTTFLPSWMTQVSSRNHNMYHLGARVRLRFAEFPRDLRRGRREDRAPGPTERAAEPVVRGDEESVGLGVMEIDCTPLDRPSAVVGGGTTSWRFDGGILTLVGFTGPDSEVHICWGAVDASPLPEVLDVSGRRVRLLVGERRPAGRHRVEWDGRDESGRPVANGIYFVRLTTGGERITRKAAKVR